MKTTLLQIVQSILSDMDSEDVNSIADTIEAQQIASVVEDTYFNLIAAREIPEHKTLLKLTGLGDTSKPTHMEYPANVKYIERLEYDVGTAPEKDYRIIPFVEPLVFLDRMDESDTRVTTFNDSVEIFIKTDEHPSYYTSFDDEYIVMNAHKADDDQTLNANKVRAYGSVYPTFSRTDSHIIDLDNTFMPLLLAEAKSACFSLFKGGSDPKIEQAARRLKSYVQNDQYKSRRPNVRNQYGRK